MQDPRAAPELRELALEEIEPNFSQPRYHFDEVALEALAGSLREHGVLQPVLVRPRPEGGMSWWRESGAGVRRRSRVWRMRMLDLSEEIFGFLEWGELRMAHGLKLLAAKDPDVRDELARRAVKEKWTVMSTAARARESNEDQRAPRKKREQAEYLDESVQAVAKAWGDVLHTEVQVRPMAYGRVRLEVQFASTDAAKAAATRATSVLRLKFGV